MSGPSVSPIQASRVTAPVASVFFARRRPAMCPVDNTLIDISDPIPAVRNQSVYVGAVAVVLVAVVSLGATIV